MASREELEEFREEMKRDAYESEADKKQEGLLRTDYDAFQDEHQELFDDAVDAVGELKDRFLEYGWEFDIRELEG